MISIIDFLMPSEIQQHLAESFQQARLRQNHSRRTASEMTGVPEATLRKFESSGEISLRQFILLCNSYGEPSQWKNLFSEPQPQSIAEMKDKTPKRQRGRE